MGLWVQGLGQRVQSPGVRSSCGSHSNEPCGSMAGITPQPYSGCVQGKSETDPFSRVFTLIFRWYLWIYDVWDRGWLQLTKSRLPHRRTKAC